MDDKELIKKLQHLVWEYGGCSECVHQYVVVDTKCGSYHECNAIGCSGGCKGKQFEAKIE